MNSNYDIVWDTSGLDELAQDFPDAVDRVLELTATEFYGQLFRRAPTKTGEFRRTIQPPKKISEDVWAIRMSKIGEYLQKGTGIHGPRRRSYDIFPKTASVLRFVIHGQVVFCKHVLDHPGMRPQPFIDKSADATYDRVPSLVERALDELVR